VVGFPYAGPADYGPEESLCMNPSLNTAIEAQDLVEVRILKVPALAMSTLVTARCIIGNRRQVNRPFPYVPRVQFTADLVQNYSDFLRRIIGGFARGSHVKQRAVQLFFAWDILLHRGGIKG
jgi:hypothetical protein